MPSTPEEAKRRRQRMRQWFNDLKAKLTCACGEDDPATIDFHHKDPTTKLDLNRLVRGWCKATILAEIAKCVHMCANCHRKGHAGRPHPAHAQWFTKA